MMKESEQKRFWEGGLPQTPEIFRFASGFLAREASCARPLGIPAPESALGLCLRRAQPSAQVYTRDTMERNYWRLHKTLDARSGQPNPTVLYRPLEGDQFTPLASFSG